MTGLANASFEDAGAGAGDADAWAVSTFAPQAYDLATLSDGPRRAEWFEDSWATNEDDLRVFEPGDLQDAHFTTLLIGPNKTVDDFEELWSSNDTDLTEASFTTTAPFRGALLTSDSYAVFAPGILPFAIPDNDAVTGFNRDLSVTASDSAALVILRLEIQHARPEDLEIQLDSDTVAGSAGNVWNHTSDPDNTLAAFELDVTSTLGVAPRAGSWTLQVLDTVATNYGALNHWSIDAYDDPFAVDGFENGWAGGAYATSWDDVTSSAAFSPAETFETWGETVFDFADVSSVSISLATPGGASTTETFEYVHAPLPCQVNDLALRRFYATNHNFVIDDLVRFSTTEAAGILPSGVAEGLDYYVVSAIGDHIFLVDVITAGGGGTGLDPVTVGYAPFFVAKTATLWWNSTID